MIDVINPADENINKEVSQNSKNAVLSDLKDEKNVSFEWDVIALPEVKFTNIQEALDYVKKQENLLMQKNRESNTEVIKEVNGLLDSLYEAYLNPEYYWGYSNSKSLLSKQDVKDFLQNTNHTDSMWFYKKQIQDIRDFLQNYKWDLSHFMDEIVQERKQGLSTWHEKENFLNRWKTSPEVLENLKWEDLVKAFKKDVDNVDKIPFGWAANLGKAGAVTFMVTMIQNVFNKYQKQQNPFK